MKRLALLLVLPASAIADPEPIIDLKSIVPKLEADGEDMAAMELPSTIIGKGKLRAARAFIDDERRSRIGIVSSRGYQSFVVDGLDAWNDYVTLEGLEWKNVVGDDEPELRATINIYHDPCACDDGPTKSHTFVVVCRAKGSGAQCSSPILVSRHEHILEEKWFTGELKIQTEPDGRVFGRVGIREAKNISRSERASIKRPQRLF